MNARSLRFQLLIWYAGLLAVVFVLCGIATHQVLRRFLEQSLADSLRRRAEQIATSLLAEVEKTGEPYVAGQIKARYAPENYDRFVRLTRSDGSVLYVSGRAADFNPAGLPPALPENSTRVLPLPGGARLLVRSMVYRSPSDRQYIIESGGPMQPIDSVLARMVVWWSLGIPALVLVVVAGGYYLVGRALAPVMEAARSAERISLRNLNERLPVAGTGDELEQLTLALNRMIERLSQALEQNRRFLADASHELRTPLTAMRGELEDAVEQSRDAKTRDRVGSALEEVERLAKIVETLFSISRLDAGEAQQPWERFDLARLAAGAAEQMALLAEDKGVSFRWRAEDKVVVEGDAARIKQVVVNLLDNAIKYTSSGGSVTLDVCSRDSKAVMEVADTGIGIPAAALPRVFDRFFRVDNARSREAGGAGLGLAIVKSICTAHGATIEVTSDEGRGTTFTVEMPLISP
jgi:heavy metal sensor kinase